MSIESDMGIVELPRPIPTWPGPSELLPHYSAGWDAYRRYHAAVQGAWLDAQAQGIDKETFRSLGYSLVADPAGFAPAALEGAARAAWCVGWAEHQAAEAVLDIAYRSGVSDPDVLWQLATNAVCRHRDAYLGPPPAAGNRHERRAAKRGRHG